MSFQIWKIYILKIYIWSLKYLKILHFILLWTCLHLKSHVWAYVITMWLGVRVLVRRHFILLRAFSSHRHTIDFVPAFLRFTFLQPLTCQGCHRSLLFHLHTGYTDSPFYASLICFYICTWNFFLRFFLIFKPIVLYSRCYRRNRR